MVLPPVTYFGATYFLKPEDQQHFEDTVRSKGQTFQTYTGKSTIQTTLHAVGKESIGFWTQIQNLNIPNLQLPTGLKIGTRDDWGSFQMAVDLSLTGPNKPEFNWNNGQYRPIPIERDGHGFKLTYSGDYTTYPQAIQKELKTLNIRA